jgi:hypothetical protein
VIGVAPQKTLSETTVVHLRWETNPLAAASSLLARYEASAGSIAYSTQFYDLLHQPEGATAPPMDANEIDEHLLRTDSNQDSPCLPGDRRARFALLECLMQKTACFARSASYPNRCAKRSSLMDSSAGRRGVLNFKVLCRKPDEWAHIQLHWTAATLNWLKCADVARDFRTACGVRVVRLPALNERLRRRSVDSEAEWSTGRNTLQLRNAERSARPELLAGQVSRQAAFAKSHVFNS